MDCDCAPPSLPPVQVLSVPQMDLCPADDQGPQTETMGRVFLSCFLWHVCVCSEQLTKKGSLGRGASVGLRRYRCHFICSQTRPPLQGHSRTVTRSPEAAGEWKGPNTRQGTRAACLSHACVCSCHRTRPLPVLQGISTGIKPA